MNEFLEVLAAGIAISPERQQFCQRIFVRAQLAKSSLIITRRDGVTLYGWSDGFGHSAPTAEHTLAEGLFQAARSYKICRPSICSNIEEPAS